MSSTYDQIAESRWGRDIVVPDPGVAVKVTPSGDWPIVVGRENLHGAMRRRAVSSPGTLVHRPKYGAGMVLFLETAATVQGRSRLGGEIRDNCLRDPRVEEAVIGVSELEHYQTLVRLMIRPRGEVDTDTISIMGSI